MAESTSTASPKIRNYNGNCHCGAVKFTFNGPKILTAFECNCSICFKKGYKHFFPGPGDLTNIRGEDVLKDYEFAGKTMLHRFCPTCGTPVMGKKHSAPPGRDISINIRTLNDVDIWALPVKKFDGKSIEPYYQPTPFTGPDPTADIENSKTYTGGCHCGNVTMALNTQGPLPCGHEYIQECDCSICMRNGTILAYPKTAQVSISFKEAPRVYLFGRMFQEHTFCGICGVSVYLKRIPGSYDTANYPDWERKTPVNLRCLEEVEWEKAEVKKGDWKTKGVEYVVPA
ncbi:Centromere protein V [Lachnellula suecica]|uniref:Centromere protein V n=1 Tax=Lachnellula suecica TaxID=602035 RepID=A0A8T9CF08_9HELO|nr:Centromere protein V [Lachnellula suecica]